jgi:hypothetical protein
MWNLFSPTAPKPLVKRARSCYFRPQAELLEDRCCPSPATLEWSDPTTGLLLVDTVTSLS